MKKSKNGKSLFYKLLIDNFILVSIPVIAAISLLCVIVCINISKDEAAAITMRLTEYANSINSNIESVVQRSKFIAQNDDLINILSKSEKDVMESFVDSNKITDLINVFNDSITARMDIYSENHNLYRNRVVNYIEALEENDEMLPIIKNSSKDIVWNPEISHENYEGYIVFYRKVNATPMSIIKVTMPLNIKKRNMTDIHVVGRSEIDKIPAKAEMKNIGEEYVAYILPDTQTLKDKIYANILIFICAGIFILLVIFYISCKINKKTTERISYIIASLDNADILDNPANILNIQANSYETKILLVTLRKLLEKIEKMNADKYKFEIEKRKMSFEILQRKINPHVLYNSLAVISHKAYINKDTETFNLVDCLVSYYRLILSNGEDYVSVNKELELIERYVSLNEEANNTRYNLEINVPDEIRSIKILHLILQPFVENAIIHGLSGRKFNNKIRITCRQYDDSIEFKVSDNGYGMKLEATGFPAENKSLRHGYGIKNTCDRINLIYGKKYGVSFESEIDKGTTVTITVAKKLL